MTSVRTTSLGTVFSMRVRSVAHVDMNKLGESAKLKLELDLTHHVESIDLRLHGHVSIAAEDAHIRPCSDISSYHERIGSSPRYVVGGTSERFKQVLYADPIDAHMIIELEGARVKRSIPVLVVSRFCAIGNYLREELALNTSYGVSTGDELDHFCRSEAHSREGISMGFESVLRLRDACRPCFFRIDASSAEVNLWSATS
jgi:hypothetical protein